MWKRKAKQQVNEVVEETPSLKEEQQADEIVEKTPSPEEKQQADQVVEEIRFTEEQKWTDEVVEETPSTEEESPYGVFIFGKKVKGFKKFLTALFSIFLLPPTILFGLLLITCIVLLAFPLISIALPIVLIALCILLIALPVMIPLITVLSLITGKGKVHFGLRNKRFAVKILGITFPPRADR